MNHSAPCPAIQARSLPTPIRTIGQDLTPPFTIYVDGAEFSDFPSIAQADAVYSQLRAKLLPTVCGVQ